MNAPAPHIYTLTGNLLAERTLDFGEWSPGGTFRAQAESFQVGGKGINVSKMLTRLRVPNTALCFVGGAAGAECEAWLGARGFTFKAFRSSQATRTGTVVRAANQRETTFLGRDVAPDAEAIRACASYLEAQPAGCVLALCGSFPGWNTADFAPLREAVHRWTSRGALVADTYGPPLQWVAGQPLELLKINAAELRTLSTGQGVAPEPSSRRTVITDGPNPLRVRDESGVETMVTPPRVREVSPTGSGDVLLACLLDALFRQQKPLREAVDYAVPYAVANAAHPGVAEFPEPS